MIRYLIKNYMKLMTRSKWVFVLLVLSPLLVTAILASAFQDLLKTYEGTSEFKAGYRALEESALTENMDIIKEAGKEAGITFVEYPEGEIKDIVASDNLAGFVTFDENNYTVYKSEDFKVEGVTLEYFIHRVMKEGQNQVMNVMLSAGGLQAESLQAEISLPVKELDYVPPVNAEDYYGLVYVVYFSWCGIICAGSILSSEKKYGIGHKFQVTSLSAGKLYLARMIPLTLVVAVGIGLAIILNALMYDVEWGNPFLTAILMLLTIMAGNAFGFMIFSLCENLAITIGVVFVATWCMGFLGGSFETYMFSGIPDSLKKLSPIYHVNRALVENSCMGHSEYIVSGIVYTLGVAVVCSVVAIAATAIRKRGRA